MLVNSLDLDQKNTVFRLVGGVLLCGFLFILEAYCLERGASKTWSFISWRKISLAPANGCRSWQVFLGFRSVDCVSWTIFFFL